MASKVVRELRRLGLVVGKVSQGKQGELWPSPALLRETALYWPGPIAAVVGGRPQSTDLPTGGGPVVQELLPTPWEAPSRVYARSTDEAERVLAEAGGHLVGGGAADWEIAVVDFPFEPGPVPLVVAALELGATPRGREMMKRHGDRVTEGWRTR